MDRQRLRRVFEVLSHLSTTPSTLSEISAILDIPLSSTHDLLQALLEIDAVSRRGRVFEAGPRLIGLSLGVLDSISVQQVAGRRLEQLAADTELDVYLAVRSGNGLVYVSRHSGSQAVNIDIPLGKRLNLHSTAVGKLFAAFDREMRQALEVAPKPALTPRTRTTMEQLEPSLRQIRAQQVSISHGESVAGVLGCAAPVRDPSGALVAAVHLSILEVMATPAKIQDAVDKLVVCARDIEAALRAHLTGSGRGAQPAGSKAETPR